MRVADADHRGKSALADPPFLEKPREFVGEGRVRLVGHPVAAHSDRSPGWLSLTIMDSVNTPDCILTMMVSSPRPLRLVSSSDG